MPGQSLVAFALAAALPLAAQAAAIEYKTAGDCDGFPAVALATPAGLCVGLVASHLGFARGVAAIESDVFVVDMGGWGSHKGRLLRLADGGRGAPEVLLHDLFQPNAVVAGPHRTLYVGVTGQVLQLDPYAKDPAAGVRIVVANLPTTGRHPMPALAVGADGALYVNVGSETDNCHGPDNALPDPKAECPETRARPPRGSVLRFAAPRDTPWDAAAQAPYARGLRNSMAMAVLPDGRLAVAANARDDIHRVAPALADAEFPHEPVAVLEPGADYGWPYCYDKLVPSPEYPAYDCRHAHAPDLLLPAHAAPLGMIAYHGEQLPGLDGKLVVGLHGYKPTGHRIVAVELAGGRPSGSPQELVGGWDAAPDAHPKGSPVGLAELADGSILVTEDHNGTLLRLARRGAAK